jgi:hypothetical protein
MLLSRPDETRGFDGVLLHVRHGGKLYTIKSDEKIGLSIEEE